MNRTRLIISAVVVFIVFQIMEYLVHEVMLKSTYVSLASIWRPEADFQSKFWIIDSYQCDLVLSLHLLLRQDV